MSGLGFRPIRTRPLGYFISVHLSCLYLLVSFVSRSFMSVRYFRMDNDINQGVKCSCKRAGLPAHCPQPMSPTLMSSRTENHWLLTTTNKQMSTKICAYLQGACTLDTNLSTNHGEIMVGCIILRDEMCMFHLKR